jgi:hypothetical protein
VRGFEHRSAYALGVLLPLLEAARRRTNFTPITGYADDFLIGGALLLAAYLVSGAHPAGPASLVAAWGILCGGLYYSFFGQLESGRATDVSGLPNVTVVVIKGAVYVVALYSLYRSIRQASASA